MTVHNYPPDTTPVAGVFDRQVFAANGTWVKPTGAQLVRVQLLGGGSGGGAGGAGGTGDSLNGGQGGAAGLYVEQWYPASILPASVAVTVGTGGAGGASVALGRTQGNPGATGGPTTFGSILRAIGPVKAAPGGAFGLAQPNSDGGVSAYGPPAAPTGSANAVIFGNGGQSNSQIASLNVGAQNADPARNNGHPNQPVGGAGGAWRQVNANATGGNGLQNLCMQDDNHQVPLAPSGTGAGVTPVAVVKTLTDGLYGWIPYYGGAGGQGAPLGSTGGTGGAGGPGQGYGAGGGGGGPSAGPAVTGAATFPSGTGGAGAAGLAIVTCYP